MDWDCIWTNVNLATMVPGAGAYGALHQAAIAFKADRIDWIGPMDRLPAASVATAKVVHDGAGAWLTPGLIDCHTHIVYGGNRAQEFELRLNGATYEEIARAGGGILSTMTATRAASEDELVEAARPRIEQLIASGVTTIEIKSGYGLNLEDELKQLRAARRLGQSCGLTVRTTFLGAHALPPEYKDRADAYIDLVCDRVLPAVADAKLADAVDVFCESIGFDRGQTERVFQAARDCGLPVKAHVEQLSDMGGTKLAAEYAALSCDHLEYVSNDGVAAMAKSGTIAVLLPGAFYVLRESQLPPIDQFRRAGVPMALATDCNPGSSPVASLLAVMNLGCTLFRLTPEEALAGVTRIAAAALGLADSHGTLEVGKAAGVAVWAIEHPSELSYWLGFNPCLQTVKGGGVLFSKDRSRLASPA